MMSHYGLPYENDDHWLSGSLELSIETLTGTAFEMKVSPNDTIMSIKSRIQSVERIPVSQQHLLYNLKELDNSASVRDYSIQNGATLKLVLSMRVGPISTKRLPPVDEVAWRELQEFMSESHREDLFDKLPSGSRVTVLIFRDGEQVNLIRVIENEDGSVSPLSDSWNGMTIRNLFSEEDPEESAKRLQENSVTMGKMQELKERLESLTIQRKVKKFDDSCFVGQSSKKNADGACRNEDGRCQNFIGYSSGDQICHSNLTKQSLRPEIDGKEQEQFRPRRRILSCAKVSMAGLSKARLEAEHIIRMQSKLSVFIDSESNQGYELKRPPLPEIRRCPVSEKQDKKGSQVEKLKKNSREKTARSFAILEEESDLAAGPSVCSSQSSILTLPSNEEVTAAIAFSPVSRERVSATVSRSRYKVSRYVLENEERPKTTPGKLNGRREEKKDDLCGIVPESEAVATTTASNRTNHMLSTISNMLPRGNLEKEGGEENRNGREGEPSKRRASNLMRDPSFRDELLKPLATHKLTTPVVKKRLRCSQCNKKLNITNTYNCRCGGFFCAVHRYSEVHSCLFDYKQEGRKLLQQMNPLIAASKLPKI